MERLEAILKDNSETFCNYLNADVDNTVHDEDECSCEYLTFYVRFDRVGLDLTNYNWNSSDMETEPYPNSTNIVLAIPICIRDEFYPDLLFEELKDELNTREDIYDDILQYQHCMSCDEIYRINDDLNWKLVGYLDDFQSEKLLNQYTWIDIDYDVSHINHSFRINETEFGYYLVWTQDGDYVRVLGTTGIHLSSPVYDIDIWGDQ